MYVNFVKKTREIIHIPYTGDSWTILLTIFLSKIEAEKIDY